MTPPRQFATLDEWIAREATSFSLDSPKSFNAVVDKLIAPPGNSVDLLGIGEPTHGIEVFLTLRNRLFERLVAAHGYCAIAIESSFPRGRVINEYVLGRGANSFDEIKDAGFSHGFANMAANRELIEWMRLYNTDRAHQNKLQFYGFDSPTEMTYTDSPRKLLYFALDYLTAIDQTSGQRWRERIDKLLGEDSAWENPAAMMDPAQAIGRSTAAMELRIEIEDLITELSVRRPELIAKSDAPLFDEVARYAALARQMLTYHAALGGTSANRFAELLGQRDAMMADNLAYIMRREQARVPGGKVLAFAHNGHLQYGQMQWQVKYGMTDAQVGPQIFAWWPAGAHVHEMLGDRYKVIGAAVVKSETHGIGDPEARTLESRLSAGSGHARIIPTHLGKGLPEAELAAVPPRNATQMNQFPLTRQSLTDFDWLVVL